MSEQSEYRSTDYYYFADNANADAEQQLRNMHASSAAADVAERDSVRADHRKRAAYYAVLYAEAIMRRDRNISRARAADIAERAESARLHESYRQD